MQGKSNSTQVHDVQNIDDVMPVYNLIDCTDNYSKTVCGNITKMCQIIH